MRDWLPPGRREVMTTLSRRPYGPNTYVNPILVRWITAASFQAQDLPDSAAVYLELTLSPNGLPWPFRLDMRILSSFAHLGLVNLYTELGRAQDAERHLELLEKDMTRPDPEMDQLLVDARAAVGAAVRHATTERLE